MIVTQVTKHTWHTVCGKITNLLPVVVVKMSVALQNTITCSEAHQALISSWSVEVSTMHLSSTESQ